MFGRHDVYTFAPSSKVISPNSYSMSNLKETLAALDARVASGDILGAFDSFFADTCTTFSNESDRTISKAQKRSALVGFLGNVASTNRIELVGKPTIDGDVTVSHFVFDFTNRFGQKMYWDELIRRVWAGGLVVSEQYLAYEPASIQSTKPAEVAKPKASKAPAATEKPEPKPTAKVAAKADDLTLIEGIGPKIAELLKNDGIVTFADLASAKVDRIKAILDAAGPRYKMHDPATWAKQSALARDGKMADLKKLQDELKGGKIA